MSGNTDKINKTDLCRIMTLPLGMQKIEFALLKDKEMKGSVTLSLLDCAEMKAEFNALKRRVKILEEERDGLLTHSGGVSLI